jgi:DNA-binding response OmpR family regulator
MLTNSILLIDDDPEEFDMFCNAVGQLDKSIECHQALTCKDGFQKLESSKGLPRCIFLDLNMPPSHGKYCLEKLKKHPVYSSVPVFIYSTSDREIDKMETTKLGAQRYFTKPNSMGELKHILSDVISDGWK